MQKTDITIIGAGVIGLAIAYQLRQRGDDIIVVERNDSFGRETSSRNSEVIHSGLYYLPGSLKASTCIRGRRLLYELCNRYGLAHQKLGKLVIASCQEETKKIEQIYDNAVKSGVQGLRLITSDEIKRLEPDVKACEGIFCPDSGIIDSHALMNFFYQEAVHHDVTFSFATPVVKIVKAGQVYEVTVREPQGEEFSFQTSVVINAAGLASDKISESAGISGYQLHFCKGQYFRIAAPKKYSIKHLIYPPDTPVSLGIHITPDLGRGLRLGPDAHYVNTIDYNVDEQQKKIFWQEVSKYLPGLMVDELIPDTAGVRPKLQAENQGFHDFIIKEEEGRGFPGFINLIGIESPGLTGCLAIAELVEKFI